MNLRRLANELGVDEGTLRARAASFGVHVSPSTELPPPLETRLRSAFAAPVKEVDAALLEAAYAGVQPLGPQPKRVHSGSRQVAPAVRPPSVAGPVATPGPVAPPPSRPALPAPAAARASSATPSPAARAPGAAHPELLVAERDDARRAAARAEAERDALRTRLAEVERERDAAVAALDARVRSVRTVADAFVRRGLVGEDEAAAALRGIVDARREGTFLRTLRVEDDAALRTFLDERLLLLGEGEPAPAGAVVVRVPVDRSEGVQSPALRGALSRFSTACLVRGKKRIHVYAAPPAWARRLREGLDARLDLSFLPGPRELPRDLAVAFGPPVDGAIHAPGRTLAEALQAAAVALEGA